ncbi:MAG: hypothetical protein ACI9YT_001129 [Halobacteriales archaeon]|jgi:hypothetical protein
MGSDFGGTTDRTTFARTLSDLKREGSNVLLVGNDATDAHADVCRRLIGEDDDTPRYRLFVLARDGRGRTVVPTDPPGTEPVRVVRQPDAPTVEGDHVLTATTDSELLSALGMDFLDVVDEVAAESNGLEPAQLRVCFESVRPLVERHRSETAFRLLHVMTSRIREERGMGHFHLRRARDDEHVRLLAPLFDAVVEVRTSNGTVEQRWHLREGDVTSDWIAV